MKKILISFGILIFSLVLVGCSDKKENISFSIGEKSEYVLSDDLVSLKIKDGSLAAYEMDIVLVNHTDDNYVYGEPYSIEYEKDGVWYKINPIIDNYGFTMIAYYLGPKESKEKSINWEGLYGDLIPGKYRVITDVFPELDRAIEPSDLIYIGAEFIVK